jgi:hypothetical protein
MAKRIDPLEDLVGELFVNRDEELTMYWEWATRVPTPVANSFALVGRRRTGKTAIMRKVFNRLFHEQERVLPVYISFSRYLERVEPISSYEFAQVYFTGYIGCYLAFRHREPMLLRDHYDFNQLREFANRVDDKLALELYHAYDLSLQGHIPHGLVQWVINFPHGIAATRDMPTAIMIDEFQVLTKVYDPRQNIHHDITDSFQDAADTRWAPLLVSGSAIHLLFEQALGGLVAGRFVTHFLQPLTHRHAHELVYRLGRWRNIPVTEELAEAIWQLTGGYPYSMERLMLTASPVYQRLPDLDALEEILTYELGDAKGALWQHYYREFYKYVELLNGTQLTKKVMFWAVKYPEKQIDAEQIAETLGVNEEAVKEALFKLYQADIVQLVGWSIFNGPGDPMLRRFIEYHYRREIEKLGPDEAAKDWRQEYRRLRGHLNNFMGEVAEMYVKTVMDAFDGRTVDGELYFQHKGPLLLPGFVKVERRGGVIQAGVPLEIDLIGEWKLPAKAGRGAWLVQVKHTAQATSGQDVRGFLAQTAGANADQKYIETVRWYVSKSGYTAEAIQLLQEAQILYSDRTAFNRLAQMFNFHGFPVTEDR